MTETLSPKCIKCDQQHEKEQQQWITSEHTFEAFCVRIHLRKWLWAKLSFAWRSKEKENYINKPIRFSTWFFPSTISIITCCSTNNIYISMCAVIKLERPLKTHFVSISNQIPCWLLPVQLLCVLRFLFAVFMIQLNAKEPSVKKEKYHNNTPGLRSWLFVPFPLSFWFNHYFYY